MRIIFFLILSISFLKLQSQAFNVSGKVSDEDNIAIAYANITLVNTSFSKVFNTYSNENGFFKIKEIPKGDYKLTCSIIGFKTFTEAIVIKDKNEQIIITLNESVENLDVVTIQAKSKNRVKQESGYEVKVVELGKIKNSNRDLNQVLNTSSGINIRQSGGLGSGFNFSLNGLSGNQVRFFIDNIPIENFGSSFSLNNFPVNLVQNVEVYKGVVPIYLGADALGGATLMIKKLQFL